MDFRLRIISGLLSFALVIIGRISTNGNFELTKDGYTPEQADVECVARVMWNECRGVDSEDEQAAVVWCILNRVDDPRWPDTIQGVCKAPGQFAYESHAPLDPALMELAEDVIYRWNMEHDRWDDVGRTLPDDYFFFSGHSGRNWFRKEYGSRETWDWSLPSPYDEDEYERS